MKAKITLYEKPTCTTCRQANKILKESNVEYDRINYYVTPLNAAKLHELIHKMGISARELLRTSEPIYRELGLAKTNMNDKELVQLMVKHPDLIQRPIVECGSKAVLARPVENIRKLEKLFA